jgi:hypothetical protein
MVPKKEHESCQRCEPSARIRPSRGCQPASHHAPARGKLPRSWSAARVALAELAIEDGEPGRLREAQAELERAEAKTREIGQLLTLPVIRELQARIAAAEGDEPAREAALREAIDLHENMDAPRQAERVARLLSS